MVDESQLSKLDVGQRSEHAKVDNPEIQRYSEGPFGRIPLDPGQTVQP